MPARTARLVLKAGRERSLLRRHPWIFSGAIATVSGAPSAGDTVEVRAADGRFLAWAAYSPASQIRARVWSFVESEPPTPEWFGAKIARAQELRLRWLPPEAGDALRLVHGESDELPGLIADRYGDVLAVQFLAAGTERWRDALIAALRECSGCRFVCERSDTEARRLEGLAPRSGWLGEAPSALPRIREYGLSFFVDVSGGQKTGFYLDQRENRKRIRALARGRRVLNGFCYSGGFTVAALAGDAQSVLSIDSSAPALELARRNVALNELDPARCEWRCEDMFEALRRLAGERREFDLIVLDPPRFAAATKDLPRAARAYKDINLQALRLLAPGGLLASFSCSGAVSAELFRKILAGAAADAGVALLLRERFGAAADHPVRIEFPEGEYLKGLLLERC